MADTMFKDQKEIDEFDDMMDRYHNMWELGIMSKEEIVADLLLDGYSRIMAERVVYLWMPLDKRPITNVY